MGSLALAYAKIWPPFSAELPGRTSAGAPLEGARLLFFDPVLERFGITSVAQRLRRIEPPLRECDVLLLRGRDLEVSETAERELDVIERLTSAHAVFAVVGSDGKTGPLIRPLQGLAVSLDPDLVRSIEIEGILRRTNALFRDQDVHYALPSQDHATAFLRMADALQDPTEVGRIADWIAPHVTQDTMLVGDNGSLLPLLLVTRERVHQITPFECHIRAISEYPIFGDLIEQLLDDVLTRYRGIRIVFIISVNSSGRLIERIKTLTPSDTQIIVICNTQQDYSKPGVICLHDVPIERYRVNSDGRCDKCATYHLVGIDPKTYERIPHLSYIAQPIDVNTASRHRLFWESAERTSAVHLHFNLVVGPSSVRHHGIYINVTALLTDKWFRNEVLIALRGISPPSLLLVPEHGTSDAVIDVVLEIFPRVPTIKVGHSDLSEAATSRIRSLGGGESILIADDALVQGTTLKGLRQAVYRVLQNMASPPSLRAFICLARPDSDDTYRATYRPYQDSAGAQLSYGYRIHLPASGNERCPWCAQAVVLSRLAPRLDSGNRHLANTKREALAAAELGTKFLWDTEELTGTETTTDSFFGNLGLKTAFAAAACAAHEVKLNLHAATQRSEVAVLNVPMALECYFDSVLLAAILRTLDRRDLHFGGQSRKIHDELARYPAERAYPGNIGEIAWAAVNHKLPSRPVELLLERLARNPDRTLLLALLHLQSSETV